VFFVTIIVNLLSFFSLHCRLGTQKRQVQYKVAHLPDLPSKVPSKHRLTNRLKMNQKKTGEHLLYWMNRTLFGLQMHCATLEYEPLPSFISVVKEMYFCTRRFASFCKTPYFQVPSFHVRKTYFALVTSAPNCC